MPMLMWSVYAPPKSSTPQGPPVITPTPEAPTTGLAALVGNTRYDLSSGTPAMGGLGYWRMEEDGLGMAPVRRLTERGPIQDGSTDIGFRLDPRTVQLVFGLYGGIGTDEAAMYALREQLLRIFRPSPRPLQLQYTLSSGDVRQLDCFYSSAMSFPSSDRRGIWQRVGVELLAPDPTFYDPSQQFASFGLAANGTPFTIPSKMPFGIGQGGSINTTINLAYTGTWRTYPTIEIVGPIDSPVVTNVTTGDALDFTGVSIGSGTTYTIDLRYGYKTVVDNTGANRIGQLSNSSDLATWSLEAAEDAPNGINVLTVTGSSATSSTAVYIRYYNRYIGI